MSKKGAKREVIFSNQVLLEIHYLIKGLLQIIFQQNVNQYYKIKVLIIKKQNLHRTSQILIMKLIG